MTVRAKPQTWNLAPEEVDDVWGEFWDHALVASPIWKDGVLRNYGRLVGNAVPSAGMDLVQTPAGVAQDFSTAEDALFVPANLLPTTQVTVGIRVKKTDAINRTAALFGHGSAEATERLGCHGPWSDGTTYWDFAGTTSGTSRLAVAGLNYAEAAWLVFTAGPRGMEMWRAGVLVGSNLGTSTRPGIVTDKWGIGAHAGNVLDSDSVEISGIFLLDCQCSRGLIQALERDTFGWARLDHLTIGKAAAVTPPTGGFFARRYYDEFLAGAA